MSQDKDTKLQIQKVIAVLNEKNSKEVLAYAQMLLEMQKSDESLLQKIAPTTGETTVN